MSNHITIRKAQGTWVVRAAGAVIGETSDALELSEGSMAPVIYFPRSDMAMAFFDKTDKQTSCPHKGAASYYTIQTKSEALTNACWSYEAPIDDVAQIADHMAFAHEKVTIESV